MKLFLFFTPKETKSPEGRNVKEDSLPFLQHILYFLKDLRLFILFYFGS